MGKGKSVLSILLSSALIFAGLDAGIVRAAGAETETGKEANAIFESATKLETNLTGWRIEGKGRMETVEQGLLLVSEPRENVMALTETRAADFIYEADVMVTERQADATLVFRSNQDGWSSYMLQLVLNAGLIRLKDASGEGKLREERRVDLAEGEIYHLKVKAEGSRLQVYWGDRYEPLIDVHDEAYASGYLGLNVWDGSALFQNVKVSELNSNLGAAIASSGAWQPDLRGELGTADGSRRALRIYEGYERDLVLEGNVSFAADQGDAGLRFRANEQGTDGYEAALRKDGGQVWAELRKADGRVIAASERAYPSASKARHHLEIHALGSRILVYVDGYAEPAVDAVDNSYADGHAGFAVSGGAAYFQDVYLTAASDYYTEKYRPDYHYSPARGSASDPNGLVYYEGEYHLFHQDGGTWAHAVSTDLVHWKRLPIALPWNDLGHVWSGSAVADLHNASGLFADSGGKGLIAYYTSYNPDRPNGNQRIGLAYSKDRGRTWEYAAERPIVIENPGKQGDDPGGWDFRDPKVVRDEEHNRWVMVVSGGDHIRFFTSTNLIDWTLTDNFGYGAYVRGGVWECPDLFQLAVDGTVKKKWVLMISTGANPNTQGSAAEYFIGELTPEGKFVNDNPAGKVLATDYGKEYYASMSFAGMPDGRRVMLAWMTNGDYPFAFPTEGWKGVLSIPRELTLQKTNEGIRLAQAPIRELESLRGQLLFAASDRLVQADRENLLKGVSSGAYEIEAEIEIPQASNVSEFGFRLREGAGKRTVVGYKTKENEIYVDRSLSGDTGFSDRLSTLHQAPLQPDNRRVKLRIYVDDSSLEVFGGDGRVVFSEVIFPDPAHREMSLFTVGGEVNVVSLKVHALTNVWNKAAESQTSIVMDTSPQQMGLGDTRTLYAAVNGGVKGGRSGGSDVNRNQPIRWETSDPQVVAIASSDQRQAVIRAAGQGEAVITASTPNGKASASVPVKVFAGEFHTNLTGWAPDLAASSWVATERGIRGSYWSDAHYVAEETAGDFVYEAEMTLDEKGGAGSVLFRASRDGRSGYYFNIDPNMKAFRLFYKIDGAFADRQVLANVPAFIQQGKKYAIVIEADGPRIRISVDGAGIIDLTDGTFAEGHFGLHVFGGAAYYQNVNVSRVEQAKLRKTSFVNAGANTSLYAAKAENGEPVALLPAGDGEASSRTWVMVPTGDELGSYSIRTAAGGKALDLDTGQNKLQLYDYLGYDNQRWLLRDNGDGTVAILSLHNQQALEASADSGSLYLNEPDPALDRQKWQVVDVGAP
ncbi:GH32 C-terminal domain-containing protein [Paenibacillus sp. J14]|uniref:GH32 C-terminal domain-containing protein n=1 Tax=Paenibacillus sp. (strain J14) TaxID=935845 RepID=UPI0004AC8B28|nr:GH32 C-terminal domain-containing protein [Paenibacillus sp. J14]